MDLTRAFNMNQATIKHMMQTATTAKIPATAAVRYMAATKIPGATMAAIINNRNPFIRTL